MLHPNATTMKWAQRGLVAVVLTALAAFGLRDTGTAVATLDLSDGTVWLSSPTIGSVVQVSAAAETVTATVEVAQVGAQISTVQSGASALVLNRTSGELGRVDGRQLEFTPTEAYGANGANLRLLAGQDRAFVVDTAQGSIRTFDAANLDVRHETEVGAGPISAVTDNQDRLWLLHRDDGVAHVLRPDGSTSQSDAGIFGPTAAIALVDGSRPFIADPSSGRVIGLDSVGEADSEVCLGQSDEAVFAVGSPVGADEALVVAVTARSGQLLIAEVDSGECSVLDISDIDSSADGEPAVYGQPVMNANLLYVPVLNEGAVILIDLADRRIARTIALTTKASDEFELLVNDDSVWFNVVTGPDAGIINASGIAVAIRKYGSLDQSPDGVGDDAEDGLSTGDDASADSVDLSEREGNADDTLSVEGAGGTSEDQDPGTASDDGTAGGEGGGQGPESDSGGAGPLSEAPVSANVIEAGLAPLVPLSPAATPSVATSPLARANPTAAPLAPAEVTPAPGAGGSPLGSPGGPPTTSPTPTGTPLQPTFTFSAAQVRVGEAVQFTGSATGNPAPTSWAWSFGDGTTGSSQSTPKSWTKPGDYLVTLTVSNDVSVPITSAPAQIRVVQANQPIAPTVRIDPRSSTIEVDQILNLVASAEADVTEYKWDFGDGSKATGRSVQKSWSNPTDRPLTVTVTAIGPGGQGVATAQVQVVRKTRVPAASITVNPSRVFVGDTVEFRANSTNAPERVTWDFGDGRTATGEVVRHAYRTASDRPFAVTVRVSNTAGSSTASAEVVVLAPVAAPVARVNITPGSSVSVNSTVFFDGSVSSGNPDRYTWSFSDGVKISGGRERAIVSRQFETAGTYTGDLVVSNQGGTSRATQFQVTVTLRPDVRPPLEPRFTVRPGATAQDPAAPGDTVRFIDRTEGRVVAWTWDFGDRNTATGPAPTHNYAAAGVYTVTLTVSNGTSSFSASSSVFVTGAPVVPPVADFVVRPERPGVGALVTFENRSSINVTEWSWNFGDNTSSTVANPAHIFERPGTYPVVLTVSNAQGQRATKTLRIEVGQGQLAPPEAAFSVSPAPNERFAGQPITFTDQTAGAVGTPVFTIDGVQKSPEPGERSVQHTFRNAEPQIVRIQACWASDAANCSTTQQRIVILPSSSPPVAAIELSGAIIGGLENTAIVGQQVTFADVSRTNGAEVLERSWNIGGTTSTGASVTAVIATAGDVPVSLTVRTAGGSDTATRIVRFVDAVAPVASFNRPTPIEVGKPVTFTDTSTGLIESRAWRVDGQLRSEQATLVHTFPSPGSYEIVLTVGNRFGNTTVSQTVVIEGPQAAPPVNAGNAQQRVAPEAGAADQIGVGIPITLEVADTANAVVWVWDFGDGTNPVITNVPRATHSWSDPGDYTVRVTARGVRQTVSTMTIRVV